MSALWCAKRGNAVEEYEDIAAWDEDRDGRAVAIVCDGATEAYDAQRWVRLLATSFVGSPPELTREPLSAWIVCRQRQWAREAPAQFFSVFEEDKYNRTGSFATLVALSIDLASPGPVRWRTASVGDAVLFHVRGDEVVDAFPPMRSTEFGNAPALVYTDVRRFDSIVESMHCGESTAACGDRFLLATDAMAHWMLWRAERGASVWDLVASLDQAGFDQLVDDVRSAGEMHNDDVTVLRAELVDRPTPLET